MEVQPLTTTAAVAAPVHPQPTPKTPTRFAVRLLDQDPRAARRELLAAMRPFVAFALGALLVFGVVGLVLYQVVQGDVRQYEEGSAQTQAIFIAHSIVQPELTPTDLGGFTTARQQDLTTIVRQRALRPPVVRVKVWSKGDVILFSDDARLEGQRFNNAEVGEALEKNAPVSEIEDRSAPENVDERALAPKLFSSYIPITVNPASASPDAVVEVYQSYDRIQAGIDQLSTHLAVTLGLGLGFLYLLLLPIVLTTLAIHADRARARTGDQEKGRFLAFMGHELRTPLNSIIGFAELLQSGGPGTLTDRQTRHVSNIRTAGRHLLDIINELLDFSRAEAGQLVVERQTVVVGNVAGPVAEQLQPAAARAGVELTAEVESGLAVTGDPTRLQQVLTNLVNNAIKFTPAGGTVRVRAAQHGAWCEIAVDDSGVGIPPSAVDKVFEPFVRVEGSAGKEGAGLGLSLSKKLVEAMGGTLTVTSTVGSGSTFTVRLKPAQ